LFGYRYNTIASFDGDFYPETTAAQFLHTNTEPYRIVTPAAGIVFPPNSSMIERIENLSGYEPGILRRIMEYVNLAEGEHSIRAFRVLMPLKGLSSPLLRASNVKYIVSTHDFWFEDSRPGSLQEQRQAWVTLEPGIPVGQHFAMNYAGLHRLDLTLQNNTNASGTVTVRIFTADGILELAHANLDVATIKTGSWHDFYFEPFPSEWGRVFLAMVEFNGEGGPIQIGVSEVDAYPDGGLTVGGQSVPGDLTFTTHYLPRPELVFEDGKTRIYLNEGYFERAFVVPQAIIADTPPAALTAVKQHAEELDQVVIIELDDQPAPTDLENGENTPGQVAITDYNLNDITLAASMTKPGFIVLSDAYYPGWRATIDGKSTPVYRANYAFRAVYVPEGSHTVHFSFWPMDFVIGAIISSLTLLGCSIILLVALANRPLSLAQQSRLP
jgi:hypothetical protein